MNKLHLLIASAMLTIGILVTPVAAADNPFLKKCQDKKGLLVHVGDDVTMTCEGLRDESKSYVEKACKVKEPSVDGAPPARRKCRESCGECPDFVCKSFYSTAADYSDADVFTIPPYCMGPCPGASATLKPLPLYLDMETTKEANVTLISAGTFVTDTTVLNNGALIFEDMGALHFSAITDLVYTGVPFDSAATGGTGVFSDAGGYGKLSFTNPSTTYPLGLVKFEICLS